jgi:hypothetical protein
MRVDVQKPVCCGSGRLLVIKSLPQIRRTRLTTKDNLVNVVLGEEPLLPHSVEVQHNWTDAESYPYSSFTLKPGQPLPVKQGAKCKER